MLCTAILGEIIDINLCFSKNAILGKKRNRNVSYRDFRTFAQILFYMGRTFIFQTWIAIIIAQWIQMTSMDEHGYVRYNFCGCNRSILFFVFRILCGKIHTWPSKSKKKMENGSVLATLYAHCIIYSRKAICIAKIRLMSCR